MNEIKRYRFVVEVDSTAFPPTKNAYVAPWEGSQESENDFVTFHDHERDVAEKVASAVAEEREHVIGIIENQHCYCREMYTCERCEILAAVQKIQKE